jgi:hypothetical protein
MVVLPRISLTLNAGYGGLAYDATTMRPVMCGCKPQK